MYNRFSNRLFNSLCQIQYSKPQNILLLTVLLIGFMFSTYLILGLWSIVLDILLLFVIFIVASEKADKSYSFLANFYKNKYYKAKYRRVGLEGRLNKPSLYFSYTILRLRLYVLDNYIVLLFWFVLLFKAVEDNFDNILDGVEHLYFDILTKEERADLFSGKYSHEEKQDLYNKIFLAHKQRQTQTAALSAFALIVVIIINIIVGLVISLILPAII